MVEPTYHPEGELSVFVSYAREELSLANEVVDLLRRYRITGHIDTEVVPLGERWEEVIGSHIDSSDALVFLLSNRSLDSVNCAAELNRAHSLGKRILTLITDDSDPGGRDAPRLRRLGIDWLSDINWTSRRQFATLNAAVERIVTDVRQDYDWVRAHTELTTAMLSWKANDRKRSDLLRGRALAAALDLQELQQDRNFVPKLLDNHHVYISKSVRRQRHARRAYATIGTSAILLSAIAAYAWQGRSIELDRNRFNELSAQAADADTVVEAVQLAVEAASSAGPPTITSERQVYGLLSALASDDRPHHRYLAQSPASSLSVAGDGSAFSFLAPDGSLRVVDSWTLEAINIGEPWRDILTPDTTIAAQALNHDASRVTLLGLGRDGGYEYLVLERTNDAWQLAETGSIPDIGFVEALTVGPEDSLLGLVHRDGTIRVVDIAVGPRVLSHTGAPLDTSARIRTGHAVSADQNRICTWVGSTFQLHQISPPELLNQALVDGAFECIPEGCFGSVSNMAITTDRLECISTSGGRIGEPFPIVGPVVPTYLPRTARLARGTRRFLASLTGRRCSIQRCHVCRNIQRSGATTVGTARLD